MADSESCCRNCKFSMMGNAGDPDEGLCKRFPPTPLVYGPTGDPIFAYRWPEVPAYELCGEYERLTGAFITVRSDEERS